MDLTKIHLEIETALKIQYSASALVIFWFRYFGRIHSGENVCLPRADKLFTPMPRFYGYMRILVAPAVRPAVFQLKLRKGGKISKECQKIYMLNE